MPSPEQPDQSGRGGAEQDSTPFCRAARFAGEQPAGLAYFQTQQLIFESDSDLSVYRLQLNRVWHVAILGQPPPENIALTLRLILSTGAPTVLPADLCRLLEERRAQAIKCGPWVEQHYHWDRKR